MFSFKKSIYFNFGILISMGLFANGAFAEYADDVKAIKKQIGCFKVDFNFAEKVIEKNEANKKFSPREKYSDNVIELVTLEKDTPNEISLVHTLLIGRGPFPKMKHWRQTWVLGGKSIWEYQSDYVWRKRDLSTSESQQWTQKISRIDDGPNRECLGNWVHEGSESHWTCSTLSPIFRRDYDRASDFDYNVHTHQYTFSENDLYLGENIEKRKGNKDNSLPVVTEIGGGRYVPVDASDKDASQACQEGLQWWDDHRKAWNEVNDAWTPYFQDSTVIELKKKASTSAATVKTWRNIWKKLYRYASPAENVLAKTILWTGEMPWSKEKSLQELIEADWKFEQ